MPWNPTTPITGGAQTGFTAPTYTLVSDTAPDVNGKQVAVSALGGTQAGVTVHSVAAPFTASFFRPKTFAVLGKPNPSTGLLPAVPKNEFKQIIRKGVLPLAGQPFSTMIIDMRISIPAGADVADPANVRAALSLAIGVLQQQSAGIGDTALNGII